MACILLVEDDRDVCRTLEHLARLDGHRVFAFATIRLALANLRRERFDLLVTDINLPDGSGLKLAQTAKEKGIPALVLTGYAQFFRERALENYDCLFKPFRPSEFLGAVRRRLASTGGDVVSFPRPWLR